MNLRRACGYIALIPKLPPTVAVLSAEGDHALAEPLPQRIADTQKERAIHKLNSITAELLK